MYNNLYNNFEEIKDVIKCDYCSLKNIMDNCSTIEDIRRISEEIGTNIEIGAFGNCGEDCFKKEFNDLKTEDIEWIRIEDYGVLSYIYFYKDGDIRFDIDFAFEMTFGNIDIFADSITYEDINKM